MNRVDRNEHFIVEIFNRSGDFCIKKYLYNVEDGDAKTFESTTEADPYKENKSNFKIVSGMHKMYVSKSAYIVCNPETPNRSR